MSLRLLFSRKYKVGIKFRLGELRYMMREWFSNWWLLILPLILVALGLYFILAFRLVSVESARWTLSALVQAGAALVGIFYVAMGILWNQASQETARLLALLPHYMEKLSLRGQAVKSFIELVNKPLGKIIKEQSMENTLKELYLRLFVLGTAASRYQNEPEIVSMQQDMKDSLGVDFTDEEKKRIRRDEFRISIDTMAYFSYIWRFVEDMSILMVRVALRPEDSAAIRRSDFYYNVVHRAMSQDRVSMGLWKLRFIASFRGKGIITISALWLACLTLGLMTLFALSGIPNDLLPYIASIPLAIGIVAMGFTLSLGFRAMSFGDF